MNEINLQAIEARAKSAQAGPWLVCAAEDAADGLPVAFFGRGAGPKDVAVRSDGPPSGTADDDVAFVAHAREDVPALVAEVRRLREAVAAEREACAKVCEGLHSEVIWSGRGVGNVAWDNARHVCASAIRARGKA